MGRAAGGGSRPLVGHGANSRRMLLSRSYRDWSVGPIKLKEISTANTEMQATAIIGALGRSE